MAFINVLEVSWLSLLTILLFRSSSYQIMEDPSPPTTKCTSTCHWQNFHASYAPPSWFFRPTNNQKWFVNCRLVDLCSFSQFCLYACLLSQSPQFLCATTLLGVTSRADSIPYALTHAGTSLARHLMLHTCCHMPPLVVLADPVHSVQSDFGVSSAGSVSF